MVEDFGGLSKKVYGALNTGNVDLLDDVYAPDVRIHHSKGMEFDRAGYKQWILALRQAMPDLHFEEVENFAAGEAGCSRYLLTGTLTGEQSLFPCPSEGQALRLDGVIVAHMKAGKCVEFSGFADNLVLMQQLGVIPATA